MRIEINMPVFAGELDERTQALKVLEEASELCEAAKIYNVGKCEVCDKCGCCLERNELLDEFADVCQTLVNLAAAFNITYGEISEALDGCIESNQERGRY